MNIKKLFGAMAITWGLNSAFKTPVEKGYEKDGWYMNFSHDWRGNVYVNANHYTKDAPKAAIRLDLSHVWKMLNEEQ